MGRSENLVRILLSLAASLFLLNALLLTPFSALLLPSLGAVTLLLSLILWGKWGSLLLGLSCDDLLELFGAGVLITLPLLYAAGALRLVSPWALRLWVLLPFLSLPFLGEGKRALWVEAKRFLHRPLWVGILILPAFLYAALPPTFYDTLVYHLAVPNHILLHRGFAATPNWVYSNSSNFYEVLLLLPLSLGERVPGLFHFFLGVLFLLTVVDFGRKELRLERGYLALLLLTLPMTLFLLGSLKNDLPAALFDEEAVFQIVERQPFGSCSLLGKLNCVDWQNGISRILVLWNFDLVETHGLPPFYIMPVTWNQHKIMSDGNGLISLFTRSICCSTMR